MSEVTLRAVVDRIEADKAVLLLGERGHCVDWPLDALPGEVAEGDVLTICIRRDCEAAADCRGAVCSLIDRLKRGE